MKRITFITGHYGSGKSEFSVNFALYKKAECLVDLDIVNPYFRTRELEDLYRAKNIRLISSSLNNALGSDLPFIAKEVFYPFSRHLTSVFDLGGDDVGSRIVQQFSEIIEPEETDFLFCVNCYREETENPEKIIQAIEKIARSGGFKITGLINNTNLLRDTDYRDLLYGERILKEVASKTGLKILYTGVYVKIVAKIGKLEGEIIPINLYLRKKWL